ncbi:hypothetical protein PITC_031700 [Penicillium italicum]|uniref:Uncharacterized protein n=1 Tax=Penicillium italicum TaxID=40296 RepID=A0A0A2L499_PENIT|nr:hypothetical protein PITC_031700 [Penicillium italicum]
MTPPGRGSTVGQQSKWPRQCHISTRISLGSRGVILPGVIRRVFRAAPSSACYGVGLFYVADLCRPP